MRTYSVAAHFNKAQVFPVFPIDPSVANVFPLVPCVPPYSPCVSQLLAAGPTQSTKKQSVLFTQFPVPCAFQVVCYLCAPNCLLGFQFPVCSRLYPVPFFPYCSQYVSCVFPVFSDCSLCSECVTCKATSCRANTTYTEIVSFVYSVHSSHIVYSVPSSYWFPVRSLIFTQCVPNSFPLCFPIVPCVPSV